MTNNELKKEEIDLLILFTKLGGQIKKTDKLRAGDSFHKDGIVYVGTRNEQ